MRYAKDESTYILGSFDSGDTVTITIFRLSDGSKVVDSETCTEIDNTGVFKYQFSQTITQKEEYLWIMSNGKYTRMGKIVLGGYLDRIDETISSRASESTVSEIKSKTDKLKFSADNDVIATLDGEKVDLVSDLRDAIILIKKLQTGKWKIENNQLIMYDEDGVTPLLTFNLYDKDGQPSEINVYERVPQ